MESKPLTLKFLWHSLCYADLQEKLIRGGVKQADLGTLLTRHPHPLARAHHALDGTAGVRNHLEWSLERNRKKMSRTRGLKYRWCSENCTIVRLNSMLRASGLTTLMVSWQPHHIIANLTSIVDSQRVNKADDVCLTSVLRTRGLMMWLLFWQQHP